MIRFNFVVDEGDAENILDCMRDKISSYHEAIMDCIVKNDIELISVYRGEIEYYQGLIEKMHNSRENEPSIGGMK